jgi:hypothetical protein
MNICKKDGIDVKSFNDSNIGIKNALSRTGQPFDGMRKKLKGLEMSKTRKVYDKLINEMYSFLYYKSITGTKGGNTQTCDDSSSQDLIRGNIHYKKMTDSYGNARQFVHRRAATHGNPMDIIPEYDSFNGNSKLDPEDPDRRLKSDLATHQKRNRVNSQQILTRQSKVQFNTSQLSPPINKLLNHSFKLSLGNKMNKRLNLSVPKLNSGITKEELEKTAEKFANRTGNSWSKPKRANKPSVKPKSIYEQYDVPEKLHCFGKYYDTKKITPGSNDFFVMNSKVQNSPGSNEFFIMNSRMQNSKIYKLRSKTKTNRADMTNVSVSLKDDQETENNLANASSFILKLHDTRQRV